MSNSSKYVLADGVRGTAFAGDGPDPGNDNNTERVSSDSTGIQKKAGSADQEDEPDTASDGGPTLTEVLRVVFDIGVGEHEAYVALTDRAATSAGDLAEELDRDRSNVNRYLNSLYQKNLVTRRRRILQSGGHVYEYSARSPDSVRELLLAGLNEWADVASDRIDQLVAETAETTGSVTT